MSFCSKTFTQKVSRRSLAASQVWLEFKAFLVVNGCRKRIGFHTLLLLVVVVETKTAAQHSCHML